MNLLFVAGTWPPDIGGSELSIAVGARMLARRGHRVVAVADDRRPVFEVREGVEVHGVEPTDVLSTIERLQRARPFDVVLTQLIYSREALAWSRRASVPSIYFVRNTGLKFDLALEAPESPTRLVANSLFVAGRIRERWGRTSDVVHPLIDDEDIIARAAGRPDPRRREVVTLVNPLVLKGGEILRGLALSSPRRRFLAVAGWTGLRRRAEIAWDLRQWALMARAHDDPTVHPPEEISFEDLINVATLPPTRDMRAVYARTRVLLFPARWDEPFGRCVLEALRCGIPVLASRVGGIEETGLRSAGRMLDKDAPVEVWSDALTRLDDPAEWERASDAAIRESAWYDLDREVKKLEGVCAECVRRGCGPW